MPKSYMNCMFAYSSVINVLRTWLPHSTATQQSHIPTPTSSDSLQTGTWKLHQCITQLTVLQQSIFGHYLLQMVCRTGSWWHCITEHPSSQTSGSYTRQSIWKTKYYENFKNYQIRSTGIPQYNCVFTLTGNNFSNVTCLSPIVTFYETRTLVHDTWTNPNFLSNNFNAP
jgi:hypothetical protein